MANPVHQFKIEPIVPLEIGGVDLSYTNSALWMTIGVVISIITLSIGTHRKALVPGRMQVVSEMLYEFVANMIRENIGSEGRRYFPLIFTLFMVVLMGNLLGMLPFSFTYTSHIVVTLALAMMIFLMVVVIGIVRHGTHFFSLFLPPGVPAALTILIVPIELISFLIRPITLSVRLFINIMVGHLLLKVVAGFSVMLLSLGLGGFFLGLLPTAFNVIFIAFEILIALLHAYVFTVLSCIYLKDTVDLHH